MVRIFRHVFNKFFSVILFALLIGFSTPILYAGNVKPSVIVTTTAIESIVSEVAKDNLQVISLIPPDTCPGHFDLKPSDAIKLNSAELLLGHSFEKETFLKKIDGLIQKESALRIVAISVKGSWMVPDIYINAVDEITRILEEQFPQYAQDFESNAYRYKEQIKKESERLKTHAHKLNIDQINAVASNMQKDLLIWLGIKVIATYGRSDEISALELQRLIEQAKAYNACVVIDNLQSAGKAGKPIVDELGIAHLTLSNFPRAYRGKVSYLDTLKENVQQLFSIVEK